MSQYPHETGAYPEAWQDAFEVTQPIPDFPQVPPIPPQNPYFQSSPPRSRAGTQQGGPQPPPQSLQHPRMPRQQHPAHSISEVLGEQNPGQSAGASPVEGRRPRPRLQHDFSAPEIAPAAPAEPIPVPEEFLAPPRSRRRAAPEPGQSADLERTTAAAELSKPGNGSRAAAASAAAPAAPKAPAKPEKPDDGGFSSGPPKWQDNVPFDETGVLLRPEMLRHHAMQAETELMSAIKLGVDDGSEAAKSQRPGFWTGAWPRRGLLGLILLVQAVLTLRNNNTAFEDEALYLYSGHLELGHLLFGTSTITDFWTYFSGAPTLYPVLGAVADQIGGLFAARLLSLVFMLGVTALLYLVTRRLFGTRAALAGAAIYCCGEATVFVGGLATYDAPALFLLALSTWLVVRFAENAVPIYLLAAFPAAIAVGTKYAALMFVPVIILVALFSSMPRFGGWAWIRPISLSLAVACVIYAELRIAGPGALTGVQETTTNRAQGTDPASYVLEHAALWGGCVFVMSLIGAFALIRLPATHRHAALPSARWQRIALAGLLAGTALLAPAYQVHLHTAVSLQKHVAFGLFFAAPLAGYGLVRLVGPHLHRVQLGIGVVVLTFALGMGQSIDMFHVWPNSTALLAAIVKYQQPNAQYLVGADEVAIYGLRGDPDAEPTQFSNTFFFLYTTSKGQQLSGNAAYTAAIAAGYFRIIAYTGNDSPGVEQIVAEDLYRNPDYELVAKVPETVSSGQTYYYVWVRK